MLFGTLSTIIWIVMTTWRALTALGYCMATLGRGRMSDVESQHHVPNTGVVATTPGAA